MKKRLSNILKKFYAINNKTLRRMIAVLMNRLDGGQAFSQNLREVMLKYHGIDIGIGTYGACFNINQVWTGHGNPKIGKYCSFAPGVCIYSRNHPYWAPSTSPLFYNADFSKGLKNDTVEYGKLEIGSDVWVGQYVCILPSCKRIGNGAVIGAGSIVTKDVPDYAIVGGVPARVIKYRFDEETIAKMQAMRWWDWPTEELKQNADKFCDINEIIKYAEAREKK